MADESEREYVASVEKRLHDAQEARELPTLTADGLVSYNLLRARELRGYTQAQAAERISAALGKQWSVAVYAAAERSHRSARVKEFSADELVALSQVFGVPITWWFLPATPTGHLKLRNAEREITGDQLLELVFPHPASAEAAALNERTEDLFNQFASQASGQDNLNSYMGYIHRRNAGLQSMAFSAFKAAGLENAPGELMDIARRWQQALNMLQSDIQHHGVPTEGEPPRDTRP
ncbi:helix-turn-helix transcriptional regulator [Streptacidiphilus sp. PB12-B1b]|uniref:helix-turn-helix domain-containing protein n=1 Tax=Streptacidiphilus sp. PB12-B1b TaxID=2705012 RepID=UPI0015FA9993|nr:helix-turn-helix transcriptional regulator [Streptacidiphilus sp. PB12-B1b]QMU78904.1 helix-turn-helix transcriptional regulator [Streptacidiphilus sp. PB12-B1b]